MSKHHTRRTTWNRLLSGVLCLALVLGLLPAAGLVQTAGAASWADPYGEQLVEWGVMSPSSDLRLDDPITRAEFVAMCNRAFGYTRLGGMPFIDVPSSAWYAQDIDIAYNAGYFNGTSSDPERPTASPESHLTREMAAVVVARNLMLQETVGESLGFTDSRDLSEWSRGLIGAAAAEGLIGGYPDGSFHPFEDITRGEVAAMMVHAIGNPIKKEGSHELGNVYGNVTISSSNVTLRNTVIMGNLYVTGGVDLGNVTLENVTVLGRILISGGGESNAAQSSVILRNVAADELVVDSMIDQFVTVGAYGLTDIPLTSVRSNSYLEDSSTAGYGLQYIEQDGATLLQLAGSIKEVVNKTPSSQLQLVKGTAETVTIDEYAKNSQLVVGTGTRIDELNLDVASLVTGDGNGQGDIINLNIGVDGCEVDILPEHVEVRPGITATVNDEVIGSAAASELSSEPRLMAGYPTVTGLKPDQAEGLYSGNKPGTIYWAVSAIADGSVSVEDLINNPAYGGNILKDEEKYQSGSIDASARTEYGRLISGLEPDGSYYISAVLVDGRGNRSPVKVTSFTTPDDTTPAFMEGYPYMSKVSCDVAQVTIMANKSCQLYWVLLPAGASVPTEQNFKSGSFGGSYGYGSQSVVKNVPASIIVNPNRLQENTDYDLYLWLNDFDGTKSSDVIHVEDDTTADNSFSFHTPDETAPVVTDIMQSNYDLEDAIEFTFAINEAPSTLYWAVVAESNESWIKPTEDMSSLGVRLRVEFGTGSIANGKMDAIGAGTTTEVKAADFANKLKYSEWTTHNFKLYYMAKDAAGNYSDVKYIVIHTVDTDPPTVTLKFSDAMYDTEKDKAEGRKPQPQADSDIILVFSEQVKGDSSEAADTFVDLYNAYKAILDNDPTNTTMLNYYKNALGTELESHISLYCVQNRREVELEKPKGNGQAEEPYGWVDFSEATVVLQPNGTVVLTLPAGKAVQLGGGIEYFFRFNKIYDDSYTANLLVIKNDDGEIIDGGEYDEECDMESFITVYAQVWLQRDETGISEIEDAGSLNGVRLDIVVDVEPQSASNPDENDCWDMIIWSDTRVEFVVYRRVDGGKWETVTNVVKISPNLGVSLSQNKIGGTQYETVTDGLKEGHIYQYGIHFTSVGYGTDNKDPDAWSNLVTMKFSLIAGTRGNVDTVASNVDGMNDNGKTNYENYVYENGLLHEIGSVRTKTASGTTTETILKVEKQFTDKRPPSFRDDSPTFTSGSSTISMDVFLSRTGMLYYVVAPVEDLYPTFMKDNKTVKITSGNDGSELDDEEHMYENKNERYDAVPGHYGNDTENKTYIPIDGTDRENNQEYIYFMTGGGVEPADETGGDEEAEEAGGEAGEEAGGEEGEEEGEEGGEAGGEEGEEDGEEGEEETEGAEVKYIRGIYSTPSYDEIFDGVNAYADYEQYIKAGSYPYTATVKQTITVDHLQPNTWYYVYVVLRSDSGTFDDVVQVYRVKTTKVTPPSITVSHSSSDSTSTSTSTSVSMKVYDTTKSNTLYDNAMLYYALARKDDLPSWFSAKFEYTEEDEADSGNGETPENPDDEAEEPSESPDPEPSESPDPDPSESPDPEPSESADPTPSETPGSTGNSNDMTVLEAMITKYGGTGLSYFDKFATPALKNRVMNYITISTSDDAYGNSTTYYDPLNENEKTQDCDDDMEMGGEYVMLVCARHYYSDVNSGTEYGFAATQGLYLRDADPPQFIGPKGLVEANITGVWNGTSDMSGQMWGSMPNVRYFTFDGTVTITFDKAIYTYDNGVLKQLVGTVTDDKTQLSILERVNSSGAFRRVSASSDNTSFTFTFRKLGNNQGITLPNLYNSSSVKSPYTLTVLFKPATKLGDSYKDPDGETFIDMVTPCFEVKWE